MTRRQIKKQIAELLLKDDFPKAFEKIKSLPVITAINSLFSFLYSQDEKIKNRAVDAMGALVAGLAENDMEQARNIMRRLMWNLNSESGGIGWGAAEAMGEIMANSEKLANEYRKILYSYMMPGGNFIENISLQKGVLEGIKRLESPKGHW